MIEKSQKVYSKQEVEKATLNYFKNDELATDVWIKKYCLKDEKNYYELTPDDMHRRIAKELARIEANYPNPINEDQIYETLKNFKYIIPQGSPMSGIGNDFQVSSLSNCFVIGPQKVNGIYEDSYGSILKIDQEIIQLSKRRAGVGTTLEHIRPEGTIVKNAALTSTGIIPFMERYSNSIREVAQFGRRGALLLSTHINSIDCELFIDAKIDTKKVTGANISIKIDDEFMDALNNNKKYIQKFPIKSNNPILQKEIDPKIIWNKLMKNNWLSAEPGILFIDNILRESVADCYSDLGFETIGVNPCGEITLCDSDSCRLLLLNLYSFVEKPFTVEAYFNEKVFIETVKIAQKYMDDIVDLELEKIERIIEKIESDPESDETKRIEKNLWLRIKDKCIKGRRTGTGITGEGDMLAALGFRYGTKDATNFSVYVHKLLAINSYISSAEMARDRGTFPIFKFEKEINNPFVNRLYNDSNELFELTKKYGRRNISLLTISPAGSVSILTQTTSGIEPLFLPYYKRRKKINPNDKNSKIAFVDEIGDSWEEYFVFHKKFKIWAEINGYNNIELLNEDFLNKIFEQSPYYKACSNDIDWKECVNMQGAINKYVDHSISKTINLPTDTTVELVDELYRTAHSVGCKGITVYRDKSRNGVLVSIEEKKEEFHDIHAIKRPKRLKAEIHRFQNNLEKWIAVVGIKDNRPYEIFTGKFENGLSNLPNTVKDCEVVKNIIDGIDIDGKPCKIKRYDIEYIDLNGVKQTHIGLNHAFNPEFWNYAKLISGIMRHGMPIIKQFELVDSLNFKEDYINTWKNGVARIIKRYVKDGEKSKGNCPECGGTDFVFAEGCIRCVKCSWSKCG